MLKSLLRWWNVPLLRHDCTVTRREAAERLGNIGDRRAVAPLIAALERAADRSDERFASSVAEALGKLGDPCAVEPLIRTSEHFSCSPVYASFQETAARALGLLGDSRATKTLATVLLPHEEGKVRRAAATALEELGEPKWHAWVKGDDRDFERLGQSGDPDAVEPLIGALGYLYHGRLVRGPFAASAARALGELKDPRAFESLAEAVAEAGSGISEAAAEALGKLGDQRAVKPLTEAMEGEGRPVGDEFRAVAAKALAELGDPRGVKSLVATLGTPSCALAVRQAAAKELGELRDSRALKPLITAAVVAEGALRGTAAVALGKLGETKWSDWVKGDERDFERLGRSGDRDAAKLLIKALREGNDGVCAAAAGALGELGDRCAVGPLIAVLRRARGAGAGSSAAEALGKLGDRRAVEPLVKALGRRAGSDAEVKAAAQALGELGDSRAVEPLVKALGRRAGSDAEVREAVVQALGVLGGSRVTGPLTMVLTDHEGEVRKAASVALGKLGETKWRAWVKGDECDFERLGRSGDRDAVEPLLKVLRERDSGSRREAAAGALGELGDPRAFKPLMEALDSSNLALQKAAASGLGKLGDPRAFEPLVATLDHRDSRLGDVAAEALGELGDPRALEPLVEALDRPTRGAAVLALGRLGDPRAFEPLVATLDHPDALVGGKAAEALGELGDPRAFEPLVKALGACVHLLQRATAVALGTVGDRRPRVIGRAAAAALGGLGDPRAFEPLIEALDSDDIALREAAASGLGKLGDPRAAEPLTQRLSDSEFVCESAANALVQLGVRHVVAPLILALGEYERRVALAAADVLARVGETKWKDWVKGDHGDVQRLGASGDPQAVGPLVKLLGCGDEPSCFAVYEHPRDVSVAAAAALAELGDPRGVEPLLDRLTRHGKDEWEIRKAAAKALVRMVQKAPELLSLDSTRLRSRMAEPHRDSHEDRSLGTHISDCHGDHADGHEDKGIGLDVAAVPSSRDF